MIYFEKNGYSSRDTYSTNCNLDPDKQAHNHHHPLIQVRPFPIKSDERDEHFQTLNTLNI